MLRGHGVGRPVDKGSYQSVMLPLLTVCWQDLGHRGTSNCRKPSVVSVQAAITNRDRAAYQQQTFISLSSEAGKSKIKAPAELLPGEGSRPGSQTAVFLLCPHMVEGVRELSGG